MLAEPEVLAEAEGSEDPESLGDGDALGVGESEGEGDALGEGDSDSEGAGVGDADGVPATEVSSLGLAAADAEPVPAPIVGSGIPGLEASALPVMDKVCEAALLESVLEPVRAPDVDTATVRFC